MEVKNDDNGDGNDDDDDDKVLPTTQDLFGEELDVSSDEEPREVWFFFYVILIKVSIQTHKTDITIMKFAFEFAGTFDDNSGNRNLKRLSCVNNRNSEFLVVA